MRKTKLKASLDLSKEEVVRKPRARNYSLGFLTCVLTLFLLHCPKWSQPWSHTWQLHLAHLIRLFKNEDNKCSQNNSNNNNNYSDFQYEGYLKLENMTAKIMFSIAHVSLGTQFSALWVVSVKRSTGKYGGISGTKWGPEVMCHR